MALVASFAHRPHLLEEGEKTGERTSTTRCTNAHARPRPRHRVPRLSLPTPRDGHAWPTAPPLLASRLALIGALDREAQKPFCYASYKPTVCLSNVPLMYFHINSFQRASPLARPSQGGEKRTAVWASRHEGLVRNDGVAPHVCDPMLVPHGWAVLERGNPWGSAGDAGLDTAAQARRAARAVDGGVVSVP
jgi:hypothetical protein